MSTTLYTTGANSGDLRDVIEKSVKKSGSKYLSAAFAYTSIFGAKFISELVKRRGIIGVSLISDIRDCITHPEALRLCQDEGWRVRVVNRPQGTFHPKVLVGSTGQQGGIPVDARAIIVGSGNLSRGGLISNIECGINLKAQATIDAAPIVFSRLWSLGVDLTSPILDRYAAKFQERNAERSPDDMLTLGVSDEPSAKDLAGMQQSTPAQPSISSSVATAAWAGLQSFTGDYTFQLEFPRDAGAVLRRIVAATGQSPKVTVSCADGINREMQYAYYEHNGMFRLNIPNDVPGVATARTNRVGLALVSATGDPVAPLDIRLSSDGPFVARTAAKSYLLGTWGKTSTRLYGWY